MVHRRLHLKLEPPLLHASLAQPLAYAIEEGVGLMGPAAGLGDGGMQAGGGVLGGRGLLLQLTRPLLGRGGQLVDEGEHRLDAGGGDRLRAQGHAGLLARSGKGLQVADAGIADALGVGGALGERGLRQLRLGEAVGDAMGLAAQRRQLLA